MTNTNFKAMRQLPHLQARKRPANETVGPPPRTVHVSELSHAKMSMGNSDRFRMVIDHNAVLEWVGFQWIFIRPAQPEDRAAFPTMVRGHA